MCFQQRADTKALLWKSGQCHSNHFIAIIVQSPQMNTVELAMMQFTIIYPQSVIVQLKTLMHSQAHQLNNHRAQIAQWTRASSLFLSQSGTAFGFHRNKTFPYSKQFSEHWSIQLQLTLQTVKRETSQGNVKGKKNLEHDKTVRLTELRYSIHDYIHLWRTPLLIWNTVGEKKRWVHYWPKTG